MGVTVAGASLVGLGGYFVRQILTPAKTVAEDETVLAVDADTVTLRRTPASASPGRYSLYWQSFSGHARIGEILHEDDESVTREVLAVDFGRLTPGPARFSSYFYPRRR